MKINRAEDVENVDATTPKLKDLKRRIDAVVNDEEEEEFDASRPKPQPLLLNRGTKRFKLADLDDLERSLSEENDRSQEFEKFLRQKLKT